MKCSKVLTTLAALLAVQPASGLEDFSHDNSQPEIVSVEVDASLRGNSLGRSDVHGSRQLWGTGREWSFSNILFHLGVCQADTDCASYHHPPGPLHCGCPDCSKPHPPHFQNSYCENLVTSESATDTSAADESDSSAGGSQKASRKFSLVMLVGAAAVLSFIAAAAVMHKRQRQTFDDKSVPLSSDRSTGEYASMAGAGAAFGAIMTRMGLKAEDKTDSDSDDNSVSSVKNAVSARKSLMERGLRVPPVYPDQEPPSFVPIPRDASNPSISQTREGIEIGAHRPSSIQPPSFSKPSTPYAV